MGSEKVIFTHNNSHYEESIVCHRGGTVVVPDGVFYTGPITLKSNVNLHLSDNATLRFLTDVDLYFPAVRTRWEGVDVNNAHPLIYAYGETNIALTGKGTMTARPTSATSSART